MPLHRASALHSVDSASSCALTRCTYNATWASVLQIRVLGWERVTKGFDARTQCDRRRYEYLLPASAFRPDSHAAKLVRGGLANGEAGANAAGAGIARSPAVAGGAPASGSLGGAAGGPGAQAVAAGSGPPGALHAGQAAQVLSNGNACAPPSADAAQAGLGPDAGAALLGPQLPGPAPAAAAPAPADASAGAGPGSGLGFAKGTEQSAAEAPLDAAERARVDAVLATYLGTHNFHNFTVRMAAGDPAAMRYILSFRVGGALQLQARPVPALSWGGMLM